MSKSTLETMTELYSYLRNQDPPVPSEADRMRTLKAGDHRRKLLSVIGLLKARAFDLSPEGCSGKTNAHQGLYESAAKDLENIFDILFEPDGGAK